MTAKTRNKNQPIKGLNDGQFAEPKSADYMNRNPKSLIIKEINHIFAIKNFDNGEI